MKSVLTFLFVLCVVLIAVTTVKANAIDVNVVERLINEKEYDVALDLHHALPTPSDQSVIWQEQLQDSINRLEDESVSHHEKQLRIQQLVVLSDRLSHSHPQVWGQGALPLQEQKESDLEVIEKTNTSYTKSLIITLVSAYLVSFSYVAWKRCRV